MKPDVSSRPSPHSFETPVQDEFEVDDAALRFLI
jgi:hypothetical protein